MSLHQPVLLQEVMQHLGHIDGGGFIDATFGAGGYSREMLEMGAARVIAFDQDSETAVHSEVLIEKYQHRLQFVWDNFVFLEKHVSEPVDGVVFDIGVSSMQLDQAGRGFSFNKPAPLDMRMNRQQSLDALEVVNHYSEERLSQLIFEYGGERKSRQIARQICNERLQRAINLTTDLAEIICRAVGKYNDDIHPATRTFQAIRIEVNKELESLKLGLKAAASLLNRGGRIVVVTFHSLEDRIVKDYFAALCGKVPANNRHMPGITPMLDMPLFKLLTRKVITACNHELRSNPRSRSAKLRAIVKL